MAVESEITLTNEERGKEWEYRVTAVNKAGEGKSGTKSGTGYSFSAAPGDDLKRLTHSYAMSGGSAVDHSYMEYDVDDRVTKMCSCANAPFFCTWLYDADSSRLTHRTFGRLSAFNSPLAGVDFSYQARRVGLTQFTLLTRTEEGSDLIINHSDRRQVDRKKAKSWHD